MRIPRRAVIGALLAAALPLAVSCRSKERPSGAAAAMHPPAKRNPAPDFTLRDAGGKPLKLSDYRGKVVLLNFWATWCPPCKAEIPWFIEFQKTYKDKGFTVIGVSLDEDGWDVVKPYLERSRINYPVVVGDAQVEQHYGGLESLPTTFIIDREGRIADVHIGLVTKNIYEEQIRSLVE
jgi:cytochrome c biogenesis protein CcmG/thiol:disulfide interchange protein DsbE